VLRRRLDGNGPDDVRRHQELQPQQDAAREGGSDRPVDILAGFASPQVESAGHEGCRQAHEERRYPERLDPLRYVVHRLLEAHLGPKARTPLGAKNAPAGLTASAEPSSAEDTAGRLD